MVIANRLTRLQRTLLQNECDEANCLPRTVMRLLQANWMTLFNERHTIIISNALATHHAIRWLLSSTGH